MLVALLLLLTSVIWFAPENPVQPSFAGKLHSSHTSRVINTICAFAFFKQSVKCEHILRMLAC